MSVNCTSAVFVWKNQKVCPIYVLTISSIFKLKWARNTQEVGDLNLMVKASLVPEVLTVVTNYNGLQIGHCIGRVTVIRALDTAILLVFKSAR